MQNSSTWNVINHLKETMTSLTNFMIIIKICLTQKDFNFWIPFHILQFQN